MKVTLIQIDETEYWELDALPHGEYIDKMYGTYLFETEVDTYCCSSVPMKFMCWLRNEPIINDALYDEVEDPDYALDDIDNVIYDAPSDDIYLRRSFVERYAENHPDRVFVDDKEYEDWDEAIQDHSANYML